MSKRLTLRVSLIFGIAAAAAAEGPFAFDDADLRAAWEESAPSFVTPDFRDYLADRNAAFREETPALWDTGAPPIKEAEGSAWRMTDEPGTSKSFTELEASGGPRGRLELAAFQGWEVKFLDAAASFRDSRVPSGDDWFENEFLRADAEVSLSDQAGTTVGFAANFERDAEKLNPGHAGLPEVADDMVGRSGEAAVGFRSNLWGRAKFATRVAGTFSDGDYPNGGAVDQQIAADSSYDFFWWGENLARAVVSITQENYNVEGEEQGFLSGRLTMENDFPIANRLYLSGGFGAYLFRDDRPQFRLYPRGRMLFRLAKSWGYFVHYQPSFRLPSFRELYLNADYVSPTTFRPAEDEYCALRTGVNTHLRNWGYATAAVYERRFRRTFAAADASWPGVTYFDPGKTRVRGCEFFYRLTFDRVEHYGGAAYNAAKIPAAPEAAFPYLPAYEGAGGLTVKFDGGHTASAEVAFVGERYATPAAERPLAGAWIPAAYATFRIRAGLAATAAAENLTDRKYYAAGGILAPGRTFRLGLYLVL